MQSQRFILGTSLAILLVISAASIGLDLKSRSDKASVDHTVGVLTQIADRRLLIRRAESAARGFALTGDTNFATERGKSSAMVAPAFRNWLRRLETILRDAADRANPNAGGAQVAAAPS